MSELRGFHIGEIGERIERVVRFKDVRKYRAVGFSGAEEDRWAVTFTDHDGDEITAFMSRPLRVNQRAVQLGSTLRIRATVKKHGEWNGRRSTIVQRVHEVGFE